MNTGCSTVASRFDCCCYQRHSCSRPRYLNYNYCAQHIVEDNLSPFTSCEYLSRTTGRKCPNPALRQRKQSSLPIFCSEHLHELIVKERHQKQKRKLRRKRKIEKASLEKSNSLKKQKLIEKLYKYCEGSSKTQQVQSHDMSTDSETEEVHRPIKDDWLLDNIASFDTDADWDDFDAVNNEVYEPLRYADVLTPEEIVATAQSKLIRLQSLYVEQFKRLFHLLQERRRQYLEDRKKEIKDEKGFSGISKNVEFEENAKVYALATCGRRTGVEALLRKRQLQKREHTDGKAASLPVKSTTTQRCANISNHTRCKLLCLPYTKYCSSHILEDPHQLLYRKCHAKDCPMPVRHLTARSYSVATDDGSDEEDVYYCVVHAPLLEMTFDFPDIVKSPEKMEMCNDIAEDNCPELPRDSVQVGSASSLDNLSCVNVNDESSNSPLHESSVMSNEVQLKTEPGARKPVTVAQSPPGCVTPESSPIEKNSTEQSVQCTVKRENLSEECVDAQSPAVSHTVGESLPTVHKENLASQNLSYANNARPSSQECVDILSPSLVNMSSAGENVIKLEPTSPGRDDAKNAAILCADDTASKSALLASEEYLTAGGTPVMVDAKSDSILPAKVHATSESMLFDSENTVIDRNLPSTTKPGSNYDMLIDDRSSSTTVPSADDDATPKTSSNANGISTLAMSVKLADSAVKVEAIDAQESSPMKDLGEVEQVQNILRHESETIDPYAKGRQHPLEPKSGEEQSDPIQLCEMTGQLRSGMVEESSNATQISEPSENEDKGQGPATTDPSDNGQADQTEAKSAKHSPDEPVQICEITEQYMSDTIQGAPNDPQMSVASNNEDTSSMPGYDSERQEQSTEVHQQNPPQGVLTSPQRSGVPMYISDRGERKPSSAEEEMAVVSLLQLCTGHASDDTLSSSAEQE